VVLGSALSATWLNAHDLLFSGGRDEETEIRVAGLDGRSRELAWLTHQAESIAVETEKELTVSPDGRTLLFSGEGAAEHHGNYVVDLTRRTVRPLVGEADDAPSFAPDGRTIAYQHVTEGGDWDVCVAKLAEITLHGAPRADCFRAAGNDREPVFLPDGRHIVFSSDRASRRNGVSSLYLLDRRSGSVRRLTQPGFDATSPKVMPDGRTVLFVRRALVPLG